MTTDTRKASIDEVLAYSYVHSNEGREYIPASHRDFDEETTIDKVKLALFATPEDLAELTPEQRQYYLDKDNEAQAVLENTELLAVIKIAALSLNESSRYGSDLRRLLTLGHKVSGRDLSLMASLVGVYDRDRQRRELEAKMPKVKKGYLGNIGDVLHDLKMTVKTVRYRDSHFGASTFLVGVTDDGYTVVWRASSEIQVAVGDKITLARAKIKALEPYNDTYQTVLTQGKLG
jgi:hypothetical protein